MKKSFFVLIAGLLSFATLSACNDENESGGSSSVTTSASIAPSSIISSTSSQGSSSTSTASAHVHTFKDEWSFDCESHWRDSTCGHNVTADFDNHDFVDEIILRHMRQTAIHTMNVLFVVIPMMMRKPNH